MVCGAPIFAHHDFHARLLSKILSAGWTRSDQALASSTACTVGSGLRRPGQTRPAIFWTGSSPGHARACRPSEKGSNWRFKRARSSAVHCSIATNSAILRPSALSPEAFAAISHNRSPAKYPSACSQRDSDYALDLELRPTRGGVGAGESAGGIARGTGPDGETQ